MHAINSAMCTGCAKRSGGTEVARGGFAKSSQRRIKVFAGQSQKRKEAIHRSENEAETPRKAKLRKIEILEVKLPGSAQQDLCTADTVIGLEKGKSAPLFRSPSPEVAEGNSANCDREETYAKSLGTTPPAGAWNAGGFGRDGFTADGRNYDGLDRKGYSANGQYALDKDGYDAQNRNLQNFDRQGFSPEARRTGIHRNGNGCTSTSSDSSSSNPEDAAKLGLPPLEDKFGSLPFDTAAFLGTSIAAQFPAVGPTRSPA
ncbi:hypothetical protein B0A53_01025 [Rhodotorula sp. CCFEE 5036]|nr:hypothetical protein B0A53_01025 [Rhodotorula sp. CCFEE 5036]